MKSFLLFLPVLLRGTRGAVQHCGETGVCWADMGKYGPIYSRGRAAIPLEKGKVVAEIPHLPASWWITFHLKLLEKPTRRDGTPRCCSACATRILQVKASKAWTESRQLRDYRFSHLPEMLYACGFQWGEHAKKISSTKELLDGRNESRIRVYQLLGQDAKLGGKEFVPGWLYRGEIVKELLLGKWNRFEMSQAMENNKLMFKVKVDGKVSLLKEQPKPFVGPVTVYASREGSTPLPGVIKHLNIRIAGGVIPMTRYVKDENWRKAVKTRFIFDRQTDLQIVDGSKCCRICKEKYPDTKVWQKFKLYGICECSTYDDTSFDPTKHEKRHGAYSIGRCE